MRKPQPFSLMKKLDVYKRQNPFSYIRSEKDILKLVNTIIVNTKGDGDKSGEDFWVKAEKLYYTALIGYIWYEAPDHEKNFTTLLEMLSLIHIWERNDMAYKFKYNERPRSYSEEKHGDEDIPCLLYTSCSAWIRR